MARSWRARRETSIPARLGFSSRIPHTRHAAARIQPAIAVSRPLLGGARENARKSVGGEARTRLKLGRHRAWAKHGHPHALGLELLVKRLAEREHIGLAGVVDRHAGAGHEGRDRRHIENAALA